MRLRRALSRVHLILVVTNRLKSDGVRGQLQRMRKTVPRAAADTAEHGCARGQHVRGRGQMAGHDGFLLGGVGGCSVLLGPEGSFPLQSMDASVKTLYAFVNTVPNDFVKFLYNTALVDVSASRARDLSARRRPR